MKKLIPIALISFALIGCGDTGDKALKAAAKAILEEDNSSSQQVVTPEPVSTPNQNIQMHEVPQNSAEQNVTIDAPPKPQVQRTTERVVRKRAWVVTQHGSNVMVRRSPSRSAGKVGYLYDTEEIWVVGETNKCEVINGIQGCWVKVVDVNGLTGYSFGGYLQY